MSSKEAQGKQEILCKPCIRKSGQELKGNNDVTKLAIWYLHQFVISTVEVVCKPLTIKGLWFGITLSLISELPDRYGGSDAEIGAVDFARLEENIYDVQLICPLTSELGRIIPFFSFSLFVLSATMYGLYFLLPWKHDRRTKIL